MKYPHSFKSEEG